MNESIRTRLLRWGFNLFPAYRRTGARVTYIAGDFGEVRIKLPLNWKTRNYVGTIFGGSMYGAVDPIYLIMFINFSGQSILFGITQPPFGLESQDGQPCMPGSQ